MVRRWPSQRLPTRLTKPANDLLVAAAAAAAAAIMTAVAVVVAVVVVVAAVVIAVAMAMAVTMTVQIVRRSLSHTEDRDIEIQRRAGQRMVGVHRDGVLVQPDDSQHLAAVRAVGAEMHAHLQFALGKIFARQLLDQVLLARAIAAVGTEGNLDAVTLRLTQQGLFEPWNDHAGTVQVFSAICMRLPSEN